MRLSNSAALFILFFSSAICSFADAEDVFDNGNFRWSVSEPLLGIEPSKLPPSESPWVAVKDSSIVRYDRKWHLFCTIRNTSSEDGRIRIGYISFKDWTEAPTKKWHLLQLTDGYHGAPQIFYFTPHRKWYLIYQAVDESRGLGFGPCFSTNENIDDPAGWTLPEPLYVVPEGEKSGLDFWVICDRQRAHLFFTTLDGRMRRAETLLKDFPDQGWSKPVVALKADIFEASHTYRLKGRDQYLSLIEAQNRGRRYYKAFIANKLDGEWRPLAASREKPFASPVNVVNQRQSWTTSYSHGELIRTGVDEHLEVDPDDLQFLFQGVSDEDRTGKGYGIIPWKLGLLRAVKSED
ncbi:non-reducing end alpha-L-arabinofuranosidase family hydrolase [Stratiformator vulcanicus]|uniref:non-reducing end alpha-L-arabinofuranosidase n=1 Tax=Stratiformator vulcanicus TaxID=2527980 RepID=A0A517R231_9PLAN|nr:non-reducing end alpha-L-arabinofuranosidase family hydrolase [Stratiformator vulcanicus]QDT37903.1 Alpha-L-arabinofuranosidase C precursor [Stratiformator vulcanicus]